MKTDDKATSCDLSTEGGDVIVPFMMDSLEDACDNYGTNGICDNIIEQLNNHQRDSETDIIQCKTVSTMEPSNT